MTPIEPTEMHEGARLVVFGAEQPQYLPLPAAVNTAGLVLTEWVPTADELDRLLCGGSVMVWTHTFGAPFQPVALEVAEPACGMRES